MPRPCPLMTAGVRRKPFVREILADHKTLSVGGMDCRRRLATKNSAWGFGTLSRFRIDSGGCVARIWSKCREAGRGRRRGVEHHSVHISGSPSSVRFNCCASSSVDWTQVRRFHIYARPWSPETLENICRCPLWVNRLASKFSLVPAAPGGSRILSGRHPILLERGSGSLPRYHVTLGTEPRAGRKSCLQKDSPVRG